MVVDAVMMGLPAERVLLMNVLEGNGLEVQTRERMALVRWTLCGAFFSGQLVMSNRLFHWMSGGVLAGVSVLESTDSGYSSSRQSRSFD